MSRISAGSRAIGFIGSDHSHGYEVALAAPSAPTPIARAYLQTACLAASHFVRHARQPPAIFTRPERLLPSSRLAAEMLPVVPVVRDARGLYCKPSTGFRNQKYAACCYTFNRCSAAPEGFLCSAAGRCVQAE